MKVVQSQIHNEKLVAQLLPAEAKQTRKHQANDYCGNQPNNQSKDYSINQSINQSLTT